MVMAIFSAFSDIICCLLSNALLHMLLPHKKLKFKDYSVYILVCLEVLAFPKTSTIGYFSPSGNS